MAQAQITEIAPDLFRICTFVEPFNLQFSQFLIRDEEPLLFHTGPRMLFPAVREAVSTLLDPARIRWIAFSHFEADECGTLPEWQSLAPLSTAVCSLVGKLVSVDDSLSLRPAKGMTNDEIAAALGVARSTVAEDWSVARIWLRSEVAGESGQ